LIERRLDIFDHTKAVAARSPPRQISRVLDFMAIPCGCLDQLETPSAIAAHDPSPRAAKPAGPELVAPGVVTCGVVAPALTPAGLVPFGAIAPDVIASGIAPLSAIAPDLVAPGIAPSSAVAPDLVAPGIVPSSAVASDLVASGIAPSSAVASDLAAPGVVPSSAIASDLTAPGIIPSGVVAPDPVAPNPTSACLATLRLRSRPRRSHPHTLPLTRLLTPRNSIQNGAVVHARIANHSLSRTQSSRCDESYARHWGLM
jgi:hypothetical protein